MTYLVMLILLVTTIVLGMNLNDKKYETQNLKNKIKQLEQKIEMLTNNEFITEKNTLIENLKIENKVVPENNVHIENKKRDFKTKEENKNNMILVTGSIFIVLAAVIFLSSTWSIIPNIIKTLTLLTLIVVFEGASRIAKNTFNLKQTSKTFHYLAMAYIPICLLSISIFSLIGDYLSISGAGKFIYLALSSAIIAFIYYTDFYKTKFKPMYVLSLIMQTICLIFIMLIFNAKFNSICLAVLIYNFIILLISPDKITKIYSNIMSIGAIAILSAINIFIIIFSENQHSFIWTIAFLFAILIQYVLYRKSDYQEFKLNHLITLSILIVATGYSIIINLHLSYHFYLIYSMLIYIISSQKITTEGYFEKYLQYASYITLGVTFLYLLTSNFSVIIDDIIHFILLFLLLIHMFITGKTEEFKTAIKFFIAIDIYIILYSITYLLGIDGNAFYIPTIATIILMLFEISCKNLQDDTSSIIVSISQNIAFFALVYETTIYATIIIIALAIWIYIVNNFIFEKNKLYGIIPLAWLLIKIQLLETVLIPKELLLGLITILTCISASQKKTINLYTGASCVYLISTLAYIEQPYINTIIFLAWSAINYIFLNEEIHKDLFKVLIYTGVTYLYWMFTKDTFINYNSIRYISLPVYAVMLFNKVINKYTQNDEIQYISFGLIYLVSILNYNSELDGMIYVCAIIAMIIYSYYKKMGVIFITSIVAIIVNVFLLTREFWLSIPWWIYLLVIGLTLICFAIYNENNKEKNTNTLKKMKDKMIEFKEK